MLRLGGSAAYGALFTIGVALTASLVADSPRRSPPGGGESGVIESLSAWKWDLPGHGPVQGLPASTATTYSVPK